MPSMNATDADFDSKVLQSQKLVLVDFWAEWCGPCKALAPTLDALADEMAAEIAVVKVNVEESMQIAERYRVRALPSLMLFRGGDMIASSTGAQPKADLKQWLLDNLEVSV